MLSPAESLYLIQPVTSPSSELIKLCLQYLCFRNVLTVEERWVLLHSNDPRERLRMFFHQGEHFKTYLPSRAEAFLLEPFKNYPTLEFFQLRNYVGTKLKKKVTRFKSDYLYPDLHTKGCCDWHYFLTAKGRNYRKYLNAALDEIENNIDKHISAAPDELVGRLEALEGNIFLLESETQKKLQALEYYVQNLSNINFTAAMVTSFSTYGSSLGTASYSFGSAGGGYGSVGDFGGFGGGSFGGGGAGGDW